MLLLAVPTGVTVFFSLPTIVRDKGDQMLSITTERCCAWLKAISREDLVGDKLKNTFMRSILWKVVRLLVSSVS